MNSPFNLGNTLFDGWSLTKPASTVREKKIEMANSTKHCWPDMTVMKLTPPPPPTPKKVYLWLFLTNLMQVFESVTDESPDLMILSHRPCASVHSKGLLSE